MTMNRTEQIEFLENLARELAEGFYGTPEELVGSWFSAKDQPEWWTSVDTFMLINRIREAQNEQK